MDTLLLDRSTWDLLLDASGNIALASSTYAISQDVASAVRVFKGECYYDTAQGMPYFQNILGRGQSLTLMQADAENVALTVPEVASARCIVGALTYNRQASGAILFTTSSGVTNSVGF